VTIIVDLGWQDVSNVDENTLSFVLIQQTEKGPVVVKSVLIADTFVWQVFIRGKAVEQSHLSSFPQLLLSACDVERILDYVNQCGICCGNADDQFIPIIESRKRKFTDNSG
jgi:hypothetical protein